MQNNNDNNESINHRPIRSFVIREGRMTAAQKRAIETNWSQYGLNVADGLLDLEKLFSRENDITFEIGFGMGDSLFQTIEASPDKDFIGVEVHRPGVGTLLSRVAEAKLNNLRIYQEDAKEVLEKSIPDNSLAVIQIFFPDPWHKKRHHKRRLIQAEFLGLMLQKLKPCGEIHLATDWENYAEQMMQVLSNCKQLENTCGAGEYYQNTTRRPNTKFEARGIRLGHGVWDLLFRKR